MPPRAKRVSSLRKEDRADSGKLEKDFQKRVGAAEPSILSDKQAEDTRLANKGRHFSPDPLLVDDDQSEDTWLVVSPSTNAATAIDISPPRGRPSLQGSKETKVRPRSETRRLSDGGSDRSGASRQPSKIPRVAGLSSNRSTPRQSSPGSESSGSSVKAKKQEPAPKLAFGRKITGSSPSQAARQVSRNGTAQKKSAPGSVEPPMKSPAAANPKVALQGVKGAASGSKLSEKDDDVDEISKHWQTPVRLIKRDQQIKEEEGAKAAASAIPSQSSGKAAPSSNAQDPSKQAKGGSYSLAKKAPPASQALLRAVSGSDLDDSDVATESAAEKQPEVAAPVPTLEPGQEVPAWELPPLTDEPSTAQQVPASPITSADLPKAPTSATIAAAETPGVKSHPLIMSDEESIAASSRPGSAISHLESPQKAHRVPPQSSSSVLTENQLLGDTVEVEMKNPAEPPAWPAPAGPLVEKQLVSPSATDSENQAPAAPPADATGPADKQSAGTTQPDIKSKPVDNPVPKSEAVSEPLNPVKVETGIKAEPQTVDSTKARSPEEDLTVAKPKEKMPLSPFKSKKPSVDDDPKVETPRAGIGRKSTKELKEGKQGDAAGKKPGCCGCSIM